MASTVLGILFVWLLSRGDGRGWPVGVVMAIFAGWVYWRKEIYGQTALNVAFFVMQLYGWWRWSGGKESDMRRSARLLKWRERALLLAVWLLATEALRRVLLSLEGDQVALDAFAAVGNLIGQALIVVGFAECWLIYLTVDVVLVVVNWREDLYFLTGLYLLYCGLAWNGWREWTRDRREEKRTSSATTATDS